MILRGIFVELQVLKFVRRNKQTHIGANDQKNSGDNKPNHASASRGSDLTCKDFYDLDQSIMNYLIQHWLVSLLLHSEQTFPDS